MQKEILSSTRQVGNLDPLKKIKGRGRTATVHKASPSLFSYTYSCLLQISLGGKKREEKKTTEKLYVHKLLLSHNACSLLDCFNFFISGFRYVE